MSDRRHTMKSRKKDINLLELIPVRRFSHDVDDSGRIVVRMPRFHVAWMQKYLVPKGKSPWIHITLDAIGSRAWLCCDGVTTVLSIADTLVEEFGDEIQPVYERIGVFFRGLHQKGFIELKTTNGDRL